MPSTRCSDVSGDLDQNQCEIAFLKDLSQCQPPYCLLL
jgi:hypothetical protein